MEKKGDKIKAFGAIHTRRCRWSALKHVAPAHLFSIARAHTFFGGGRLSAEITGLTIKINHLSEHVWEIRCNHEPSVNK